jgi:hypothetical protein
LSESIDLPWLRWACLRRPVGSRVRFCQEIGRLVRAYPGKTHALMLDPWDLFGSHSLNFQAALGWSDPREEKEARAREREEAKDAALRMLVEREARVDPVTAYCRRLLLVLQAHGLSEQEKVQSPIWRRDPSTDKQAQALARMAGLAGRLGDPHAGAVLELARCGEQLSKGGASDLFEVLMVCKKHRERLGELDDALADVDGLAREHLDAVRRGEAVVAEDDRWYCAGAIHRRNKAMAIVVIHHGKVVHSQVRDLAASDHPGAVDLMAVAKAIELGAREVVVDNEWTDRFLHGAKPKNSAIQLALRSIRRAVDVDLVESKHNPARGSAFRLCAVHARTRKDRAGFGGG